MYIILHYMFYTNDKDRNNLTSIKDFYRVSIIWPAFELPSRTHSKHCHYTVPVSIAKLGGVVCDTIGNSKATILGPLNEDFSLTLTTLCSFFL